MSELTPNADRVSRWLGLPSSVLLRLLKISSVPLQLAYGLDLVSVPVGLALAATFFGLLAASGVMAWRASLLE